MAEMQEWKLSSLKDAGVVLIDCDHRTPPAAETGYPYIAIPQLKNGRIDLSEVRKISPTHFEEWTRKANPQHHDVILSRRCNPGETAHVPPNLKCALGQNLVLLRADGKKVLQQYLRWLTQGPLWWEQISKFINVGAVFDSLRCADVPKFEIPLPPISEQRAIAAVLGALDDKIELNQRMNETLEAIASALFKSWFVDFDPVKAKAEGRKPEGMDEATASLFPARFHDGIPEGWSIKSVSEAIILNPSEKLPSDMEAPYLDMAALPTRGCIPDPPVLKAFSSGTKFRNGDTLLARITPCLENGKTAYIAYLQDDQLAWGSTEFIVIRSKSPLPAEYTYLLARDQNFRAHAIQSMTGTSGRQRVQTDALGTYKICIPTDRVAQEFGQILHPLFMKIVALSRESNTLSQLRDALLPRLISGKLRVGEISETVEALAS